MRVNAAVEVEIQVPLRSESDLLTVRQQGLALMQLAGFTGTDSTLITTVVSDVARKIIEYAHGGEILIGVVNHGGARGILVKARDNGNGIPDLLQTVIDDHEIGRSLQVARELMDEFSIDSEAGAGTTVTMKKWMKSQM